MNSSIWTRRSTNSGKLSLSMTNTSEGGSSSNDQPPSSTTRTFSSSLAPKPRIGSVSGDGTSGSSHGGRFDPFKTASPLNTGGSFPALSSPTTAFGLGSGAFAAFGSSIKTPTKPAQDPIGSTTSNNSFPATTPAAIGTNLGTGLPTFASAAAAQSGNVATRKLTPVDATPHPIRYTWVVWYRSPGTKFQDYEKSTQKIAQFSTVEEFWAVYSHLKRPNTLPHVSDYHIFKKGIRPVWEDEENRKGGKWIIRLKKGVSTRYWEDLLLAIIGDQFGDSGEDLCGAVLSIRSAEDVLSVWTRIETGANLKIRETIKRVLAFPQDTVMVFKSHDESIAHERTVQQGQGKHVSQNTKGDNRNHS